MRYKGLILEGSDCLGKTTLAKSAPPAWEYVHSSRPADDVFWPGWMYVRVSQHPFAVFDRLQLGGLVYGLRLGLHPVGGMTESDFREVTESLRRSGYPTLVLYSSNESLYRTRLGHREEMYDVEQIVAANAEYAGLSFVKKWDVDTLGFPSWLDAWRLVHEQD